MWYRVPIGTDRPDGDGVAQTLLWDTSGVASGSYTILAVTDDGANLPVVASSAGVVTINAAPSVSVSGLTARLDVRVGSSVGVAYVDDDPDDEAATDLFADADGDPATTDDRYAIAADRAEQDGSTQSVDWDTTGVVPGSYVIVAVVSDGVNPPVTATSAARVAVYDSGHAIELAGDGGHVAFSQALIGDRTTFTFECWIKPFWPPVAGAPNPTRNSIYSETRALDGVRHSIQVLSEDPAIPGHALGAVTCIYWVSPDVVDVFTQPVLERRWQHVAVVREGGTLRLYVDGALHDTGAAQSYSGPEPDVFRIGNAFGRNFGRFIIDEVRVSSIARYASNFRPEAVFSADADTLSLWHFDEVGGMDVIDAAGMAANGTLSASAVRVPADRYAVSSVFDRFEDGAIDATVWEVLRPFPSSDATESGGTLGLERRPYVATLDEWTPDAHVPLVVESTGPLPPRSATSTS